MQESSKNVALSHPDHLSLCIGATVITVDRVIVFNEWYEWRCYLRKLRS